MLWFTDALEAIARYMEMGGPVLWAIAGLAFVMWTLILERIWYYKTGALKADLNLATSHWEARAERTSWYAHKVREKLISEVNGKVRANLPMVKTMVAAAPLFGLLGTVTGMINVFEVMAITGGGDARQMAGGVFRATIPTLSGMVIAIAGVFADTYLNRVADKETALLEDHLTMDH
jgi:biopolymer transport protein ExbB